MKMDNTANLTTTNAIILFHGSQFDSAGNRNPIILPVTTILYRTFTFHTEGAIDA